MFAECAAGLLLWEGVWEGIWAAAWLGEKGGGTEGENRVCRDADRGGWESNFLLLEKGGFRLTISVGHSCIHVTKPLME